MILLLLFTSVYALAPQCRWACDDPMCDAICEAVCDMPQCNFTGTPCIGYSPQCSYTCNQTYAALPAVCDSTCQPPPCVGTTIACAPLNCGWRCIVGECVQPQCQAVCEMPVNEFLSLSSSTTLIPSLVLLIVAAYVI
jgi:hypothetical protein